MNPCRPRPADRVEPSAEIAPGVLRTDGVRGQIAEGLRLAGMAVSVDRRDRGAGPTSECGAAGKAR